MTMLGVVALVLFVAVLGGACFMLGAIGQNLANGNRPLKHFTRDKP